MDIMGKLKHMVTEDDDPAPKHGSNPPKPADVSRPEGVSQATNSSFTPVQASDETLQKLRSKTSFDNTDVGRILQKFLTPLESIGLDEKTKFRAAMATARAQANLSVEAVLSTFDFLQSSLQDEQKQFEQAASLFDSQEVKDRQVRLQQISDLISQKKKELDELTAKISTVSGELAIAQKKEQDIRNDFLSAVQARVVELAQEKAKYSELLKG